MFNVVKIFFAATVVSALASCSHTTKDESESEDPRLAAADSILSEARRSSEAADYDKALALLDTLDIRYRDCLDARRAGTELRLKTISTMCLDSITYFEAHIRTLDSEIESMADLFTKTDVDATGGYIVAKRAEVADFLNSKSLQARIDEDNYCFIVANLPGRDIGLDRISMGDVSTLPTQSINFEGSEMLTVEQEKARPLFEAVAAMDDVKAPVTFALVGTRGKAEVKLTAQQVKAFADTWRYGLALQQRRSMSIKIEKFERQLASINDRLANLSLN